MTPSQEALLIAQSAKIDAIYASVEKTRKTFQIIMWITIVTVVLPFILLLFAAPMLMNSLTGMVGVI